jgi:hypothetical protein
MEMPTKRFLAAVFALTLMVCGTIAHGAAQESTPSNSVQSGQAQTPAHAYRLDYLLTETEDGKKIDSRKYSLNLGGGGQAGRSLVGRIQVGPRVPVGTKADGTTQSLDVGTNLVAGLTVRDGVLSLSTTCDLTSVAPDDAKIDGRPILRTLTLMADAPLSEGKPMLVGTADDPNSKREFQLEVTATEMK